jgi:hypothetical protein
MKKITSFSKSNSQEFDFCFLNKILYNKNLLRENSVFSSSSSLYDNNDFLSLIPSKKQSLFLTNSFNSKIILYKSRSLNLFSFELNNAYFSNRYKLIVQNLNKSLFCLSNFYLSNFLFANKNTYLYIIKPIKGGFTCYYNGILGFCTKKSFSFFCYKYFLNFLKLSLTNKINNLYKNTIYIYMPKKILVSINVKIRIYPEYLKKRKYSNKYNNLQNKLNIIFGFDNKI